MKKYFIAFSLVCAILMGFPVKAATVDTNYMATVPGGDPVYSNSFEEVDREGAVVTLLKDVTDSFTVNNSLQLDLNGKTVHGIITVAENITLQVSDKATADYDVSDGKYGTIQTAGNGTVVGAAATADSDAYLKVEKDGKLSFHAVALNIDGMAMKIEQQGLYYEHTFKADDVAKAKVLSYGIIVNKTREPVAADLLATPNPNNKSVVMGDGYAYTSFFGDFDSATSALVSNIMKEKNGRLTNKRNANTVLYGKAYIQTEDGYLLGINRQRSLCQQVELADEKWNTVTQEQKNELLRMYRSDSFHKVMKDWSVSNLKTYQESVTASSTTSSDVSTLDALYAGREAYHGELHDHANTGGSSDGGKELSVWLETMDELNMDFAAILDHRQALHMDLPEWDDTYFLGGSEASCVITDRPSDANNYHYDMVFADKETFERVLYEIEEFDYKEYTAADNGGKWVGEMHFKYPNFTAERFNELITKVKEEGGYFSLAHPGQSNATQNGLDMYYQDYVGFMVFYGFGNKTCDNSDTQNNYGLWLDMLAAGKRVWAAAGNDAHFMPQAKALSTIYSEADKAQNYLDHMRTGDYVAGFAGIRMAVGNTVMGSTGTFENQRLVFSVGDFYESMKTHNFTVSLMDDVGTVFTEEISGNELKTFAIDADKNAKFYRVEVYDQTDKCLVALGNPIWNSAFYQD